MYNDHVATCSYMHVVVLLPPSCAMVERLLNLRNFQRRTLRMRAVWFIHVHVYFTQHVEYVVASNKDWLNMVAVLFSIKKRQRMSFWRSFYSRSFFYARNFPLKRSVGSRDVSVRYNQRNAVFSHEPIT